MTRILLAENNIYGHYLEYIHHLYEGILGYDDLEMVMILPEPFKEEKGKYTWTDNKKVKITYFSEEEMKLMKGAGMKMQYNKIRLIAKYAKQYQTNAVFLLSLFAYNPIFLLALMPKRVYIYGIVYKIFLYRWESLSLIKRLVSVAAYTIIARMRIFKGCFVLNDKSATSFFNKKFKTDKFIFLTDPYNKISYSGKNLRRDYHISDNTIIFLHFGAMTYRKGTMEIVKAISEMTEEELEGKVFVFAGKVGTPIKSDFYASLELIRNRSKVRIIVIDEFCSNETLVDWCVTSDCILAPYQLTDLSSGVLGYAATYKIPLIGPSEGLIGKLIRRYKLGYTIKNVYSNGIREQIIVFRKTTIDSGYDKRIEVEKFVKSIYDTISVNDEK